MITDNEHPPLNNIWRDPQFILALAAGPIVWVGLWMILQPDVDLAWPLRAPLPFLLLALIYPVLEEWVFRGLLQGALWSQPWGRKSAGGISLANLVASLAFTALHFVYHTPLWAGLVFLPSLVFGYFRDRYHAVLPALILHVFCNAGYFWLFASRV